MKKLLNGEFLFYIFIHSIPPVVDFFASEMVNVCCSKEQMNKGEAKETQSNASLKHDSCKDL